MGLTVIFLVVSAVSFWLGMQYGYTKGMTKAVSHVKYQLLNIMQKVSPEARTEFDRASIQVTMEYLAGIVPDNKETRPTNTKLN